MGINTPKKNRVDQTSSDHGAWDARIARISGPVVAFVHRLAWTAPGLRPVKVDSRRLHF